MSGDDPVDDAGQEAWLDGAQARAAVAAGGLGPPSTRVGQRVRPSDEPVSPWRAMAGAAVAVAGVALGIGAVLTLTDDPRGSVSGPTVVQPVLTSAPATTSPAPLVTPTPTAAAPVTSTAPTPSPSPLQPPLTVLNNSRVSGLADRGAARFRRGGWPVAEVGNYSGATVPSSTVYYAAGQQAAAQRLATAYGLRVLPRSSGLPGKGLTVVLTRSFAD